jgi:VanZ family protein
MTQTLTIERNATTHLARYPLWVACAAWAGVIFWFSSRTGSQVPGRFSEVGHFAEYFIFGALLYWALRLSGRRDIAAAAALIVASLYGMSDEFHQHFVPTRTPDIIDWGVDTLGAACGILLAATTLALARRLRNRRPAEQRA